MVTDRMVSAALVCVVRDPPAALAAPQRAVLLPTVESGCHLRPRAYFSRDRQPDLEMAKMAYGHPVQVPRCWRRAARVRRHASSAAAF
jgi:hypothetical protein